MLLSISLIVLTMATLFLFYTISLGATERAGKYTIRTQQARVVLQQLAREIRQAFTGASDKAVGLTGKMYSVTLLTSGMTDPALMYSYGLDTKPPIASCDMHRSTTTWPSTPTARTTPATPACWAWFAASRSS